MSVLTYVVIANSSDAREVGDDFLSKKFIWLDFPVLDVTVLDALHSVLSGGPVHVKGTPPDMILTLLYEQDPLNGCWVYQIPNDWVKLFANIDIGSVPELTKQLVKKSWLLKDFHASKYLDIPSVEKHLTALVELSKKAIKAKSSLLLWVSL